MTTSPYKQLTVSRGFKYNYYYSESSQGSPMLVFLHGFGMGSKEWRHQVSGIFLQISVDLFHASSLLLPVLYTRDFSLTGLTF